MYNRYGSHIKPDMYAAPLCKMHRCRHSKKMFWLATMEGFTQSILVIFGLEICRGILLSRQGAALINFIPHLRDFFIEKHITNCEY